MVLSTVGCLSWLGLIFAHVGHGGLERPPMYLSFSSTRHWSFRGSKNNHTVNLCFSVILLKEKTTCPKAT